MSVLVVVFLLAKKQVLHFGTLVLLVHLLRKQPLLDLSMEYPLHKSSFEQFDLQKVLPPVKVV